MKYRLVDTVEVSVYIAFQVGQVLLLLNIFLFSLLFSVNKFS